MKLELIKTIKEIPVAPFDFDSTFHKPDHFTAGDNYFESGTRWQTFNWKGEKIGVKFVNKGGVDDPLVEINIFASKALDDDFLKSLITEIRYRYNFDLNLSHFYEQFRDDEILSPIIKKWRGMKPGHPSSLYEYLIIGIVLQNATVRRSLQMFQALIEKYGELLEFDGKKLWCLWEIGRLQNVEIEELRALKVGYRAKSIRRIDDNFYSNLIDEYSLRNSDLDTQRKELLKLYGVGPATVWYLLFDVFHNLDFFNHISPWEQKIYSKIFFDRGLDDLASVHELLEYFERFGEYKQLAVHYIWEDLFWRRKNENIPWLEKEIRL